MVKFRSSTTKGLTLVWVVLMVSSITNAEPNSVDLDALYTIFETIAEPILQSVRVEVSEDDENSQDSELEQRIKQKIENPSFVPNKHMSKEIPVTENSEETVILGVPSFLEIQPNRRKGDSKVIFTYESIAKYKQLQQKIGNLLNKEKISDKTKYLLTNAFAKVINQLNRPCIRNNRSEDSMPKMNRRLLGKLDKAARKSMLKSWKYRFNKLIDRYREEDASETFDSKENSKFLAKLRDFFFEMHNDFQNLTKRYDFSCNVVNIKKIGRSENKDTTIKHATTHSTLNKDKINEKKPSPCKITKICPYELKLFLTDFYTHLIDKVDLVFHNYKKMYLIDLSRETSNEKRIFMRVLDDVKNQVSVKYNETIIKDKSKIVLDSSSDINVKVENIKRIIDKTITKVKVFIDYALTDKVGKLSSKIQSAVKSDIRTNADMELSEVQDKFKAEMCKAFETCYGKDRRKKLN